MKVKTITFLKRKRYLFNANREKKYNFAPKLDAVTLAGARVYEKIMPGFRMNLGTVNTLAMGILARLRLAKIRTMARSNSPDTLPKRTKKVRLGINFNWH